MRLRHSSRRDSAAYHIAAGVVAQNAAECDERRERRDVQEDERREALRVEAVAQVGPVDARREPPPHVADQPAEQVPRAHERLIQRAAQTRRPPPLVVVAVAPLSAAAARRRQRRREPAVLLLTVRVRSRLTAAVRLTLQSGVRIEYYTVQQSNEYP